jgi:hypothetical protein
MERTRQVEHNVDFCVVGGGMAGLVVAVSAARRGAKVALINDRPVLGGNASSECRMHVSGADRHNGIKNMRETGILEELRMKNLLVNPQMSYSIWDTVLYETVKKERNITLLLNCSCLDAEMDGSRITAVKGWQTTTYTYHRVRAKIFADCSGDAILAPLTGAQFRMGREARGEYGESIAPERADNRTMGMTCLFQAREYSSPQPFVPPDWAYRFDSCDQIPYGLRGHRWPYMGYWWIELGGEHHTIYDTEILRDELLKIVYGVWDHIKNRCPERDGAENLALDWIQFLPAKRESRRYIGAYVLTQNDIESEGRFDDIVAYGGWSMDDHHPAGFNAVKLGAPATIFHPAPSPYGIPYRSLYSRNIDNLMFAGRNASCTHTAMSSTRVMGTGSSMGQAVGTAAALAVQKGILPAGMTDHMKQLQQALLYDDAYIPWSKQVFSPLTMEFSVRSSSGNPETLRDGINRPVDDDMHSLNCREGDSIEMIFRKKSPVNNVTLILDSGLDKLVAMSHLQKDDYINRLPEVMPRVFRIEGKIDSGWKELVHIDDNYMRLARFQINRQVEGIRFVLEKTYGAAESRIYAFYVD